MRLKMKNRSHIYGINRPRPRHGHKYTKYTNYEYTNYKMGHSTMRVMCIRKTP